MKKFLMTALACMAASAARAETLLSPGEAGYQFLAMPVSARSVSLGSGLSGDTEHISAFEHNPSAAATLKENQFSFTRSMLYQGSNLTSFSIGVKPSESFGAAIQYRRFGDSDVERDASGYELDRDVDLSDNGFSLAFAYRFAGRVSAGYSVEYVRRNLFEYSAIAVTHGVGAQYYSRNKRHALGLSVQNIGKPIVLHQAEEEMPGVLRLGGSHRLKILSEESSPFDPQPLLTAIWELRQPRDSKNPAGSLGAEWRLSRHFALRAAGLYARDFSVTGGLGVGWRFIRLDYGVQNREEAGLSHTMTVVLTWGPRDEDDDF